MQLPRMTVRRLMVYVALFAVVPQTVITAVIALVPRVEAARRHWALCRQQASQSYQLAATYRAFASGYAADAVIPGVTVRQTENGPVIPATGRAAASMARHFAGRAQTYEQAKWRPWAGMPPEPPWPKLILAATAAGQESGNRRTLRETKKHATAVAKGRAEADAELKSGEASIWTYGQLNFDRFFEFLDRETGLYFSSFGCVVDDEIIGRVEGHNARIAEYIRDHGPPKNSFKPWEKDCSGWRITSRADAARRSQPD